MSRRTTTIIRLIVAATFLAVLAACGEPVPPVTKNTVTVAVEGSGTGTVTSAPTGIDLASGDAAASFDFDAGTEVTLTAQAAAGSTFAGWGGDCAGAAMAADCVLTINDDVSITATFTVDVVDTGPFDLTVQKAGSGDGTVVSDVGGIDLAVGETEQTAADLAEGTVVTLTATPDADSTFTGWSSGCTGTATTCVVTMTADATVTATFRGPGIEVTESFTITDDANDVEEFRTDTNNVNFPTGTIQVGSSDLDFGYDLSTGAHVAVGLRFVGVTIPQDATVTSATLTFTRLSGSTVTLNIVGEATSNAAPFDANDAAPVANFDVTSRADTTAAVTWTVSGNAATEVTPDLSAIVQEIVTQGGWTSGNALVFVIQGTTTSSTANFRAESAALAAGTPPVLTVTYSTP